MPSSGFERAADRGARQLFSSFGEDVRRLREDAGLARSQLARASGVDASYLVEIENGEARPSIATCVRLALALGADLPLRLYPTTGPSIRDRHQAGIAEAILGSAHSRWRRYAEVAVRRPARGWIDLGLHDRAAGVFVAIEIQSDLRRLEQLLRWSELKASALPSWDGWAGLGPAPEISRLLVVRETRRTRSIAAEFRRLLRAAYPADSLDGLESLLGTRAWPGPVHLWAARPRSGGSYFLAAR